jgi:hypothetical protein
MDQVVGQALATFKRLQQAEQEAQTAAAAAPVDA